MDSELFDVLHDSQLDMLEEISSYVRAYNCVITNTIYSMKIKTYSTKLKSVNNIYHITEKS